MKSPEEELAEGLARARWELQAARQEVEARLTVARAIVDEALIKARTAIEAAQNRARVTPKVEG